MNNNIDTVERVAIRMEETILRILSAHSFTPKDFTSRELTLSQAYCLLWQNSKTGEVSGRQGSHELLAGCASAVLLDLFVMGKIVVSVTDDCSHGALVKNVHTSPTGSYFDRAMLNNIVKHQNKYPGYRQKLRYWIQYETRFVPKRRCATITLDSLAEQGILEKKESMFRTDYPSIDPGPKGAFIKELHRVLLEGEVPDVYLRTLLTLIHAVDSLEGPWESILAKYFTDDQLTRVQGKVLECIW
ncbi:uncharacterized protein LOC116605312 [Nematostella vectensis]|uniref:uncharacterized protein LOC116605312 n=1 Tax=Nematostella vectensis TaxID=45351 RepID=UPI002077694D|nr:uncharacterized protein LOC116605312 [Nematostella vectensis]